MPFILGRIARGEEEPIAKVLSSKTVFRSPVFDVVKQEVIEPQGVRATRV